ncbi:protein GRIM REAPER [Magnolia sinica]|uniref:protein GRIM REAPER n=1 Tax=Magnolia sinica TaxID=86752 RepID=UPI002657DDD6|nr:protein GRIM REAPER [Magnolia sinica]
MTTTLPHFKLTTILSITITLALLIHIHAAIDDVEFDEEKEYVMDDHFLGLNVRSGSRFLATKIEKGASCDELANNICSGVSVNNSTGLLQCCKKHCRDVLGDRNNCGVCGQKCGFGQLCCYGKCTDIAYNVDNCGKCDKKCRAGVKCEYGVCGYA